MNAKPVPVPVSVLLRCARALERKARYVFDTLLLAAGVPTRYVQAPPDQGPWIDYGPSPHAGHERHPGLFIAHDASAWRFVDNAADRRIGAASGATAQRPWLAFAPDRAEPLDAGAAARVLDFDLPANAFYFLSSIAERRSAGAAAPRRQTYADSEFARTGAPQDIVDRYLQCLLEHLPFTADDGAAPRPAPAWPDGKRFAVALSHDVDFLPSGPLDNMVQGAKTVARHLVRHHDPADALAAARGWALAFAQGRDPYGCVPQIIARERDLGLRSSFQVAVGRRHADDVNYDIRDDRVRDYLRCITDAGFDLCLHGSVLSTDNPDWYIEEAALLGSRLERPLGSRQHFLCFDYDRLFTAQEAAGIRYDMSMGYPDRPGPRAGFSYPYFPYNLREDRPYRVLQISLFLMDVTLRGYMKLRPAAARTVIDECLSALRAKGGGASVVWHPIVFGGARDPGYDRLYFDMAARVRELGGVATDARTLHDFWRLRASAYESFQ